MKRHFFRTRPNQTSTERDDTSRSTRDEPDEFRGLVLAPVQKYVPGGRFVVVARLPAATTVEMLDGVDDDGGALLPRPDEFYGYAAEFRHFGTPVYGFVFSRTLLPAGTGYRLVGEPTVFDGRMNLMASPFVQT